MVVVDGGRLSKRSLVYSAAYFAWDYLMPRIKNCDVWIYLRKIDACGYCMQIDKREFEVEIHNRLMGDNLLTAIFHEMVHVKQGVRKEWNDSRQTYNSYKEYLALPWEVEAYELQEEILEAWYKK